MTRLSRSPETTPVVVSCCRTAIGRSDVNKGVFRKVRGDELAALVVAEAVARGRVVPECIEDVVVGVTQLCKCDSGCGVLLGASINFGIG